MFPRSFEPRAWTRAETPRLTLVPWHLSDAEALDALRSADSGIDAALGGPGVPSATLLESWRARFRGSEPGLELAAHLRSDDPGAEVSPLALDGSRLVGGLSLRPRMGWPGFIMDGWIGPHARDAGLGTELFSAGVKLAFEALRAEAVFTAPAASSPAGLRIATKLGFLPSPSEPAEGPLTRLAASDYPRSLGATLELTRYDADNRPLAERRARLDL